MATADTARLIALLELQDKFSGPAKKAEGQLTGLERKMGALGKSGQTLGRGIGSAVGTVAKIGAGAAVAGVGLLAVNVKAGVDALNELENVTVATNTVLKSTKGVSGQTAAGIRDMSEGFETLNSTMDDKVIQSGANMLLTFTNVREKAFEPALEAALNMNEAMGRGPEGLQSTVISLGVALNDPVKGIGRLRKAGVQLSKDQEKQIKTLVEQNDLYGAQQIILDELTTQFGGRFAAAGKTAEGRAAALSDRIEDVQKALAGPLIPAIDRVRDRLITFLGSDTVLRGAERLGEAVAGLFTDQNLDRGVAMLEGVIETLQSGDFSGVSANISGVVSAVSGLPWESIGNAAELLGTGSKALLDAFLGLPPWVQTAVLTGWGLNKLTGGALGSIVGELGKGLIKGVLNMNAGVVNVNARTVTGGGGGFGGGKAPRGGTPTFGGGGGLGGAANVLKFLGPLGALALGAQALGVFDTRKTNQGGGAKGPVAVEDSKTTAEVRNAAANQSATSEKLSNSVQMLRAETQSSSVRQALAIHGVGASVSGLGPRIDRVANTPHNVTVHNRISPVLNVSIHEIRRRQQSANRAYSDLSAGI